MARVIDLGGRVRVDWAPEGTFIHDLVCSVERDVCSAKRQAGEHCSERARMSAGRVFLTLGAMITSFVFVCKYVCT